MTYTGSSIGATRSSAAWSLRSPITAGDGTAADRNTVPADDATAVDVGEAEASSTRVLPMAGHAVRWLRAVTSTAKHRAIRSFDRYRVVTIEDGPAVGLRIGLQQHSNYYRTGAVERPVQLAVRSLLSPGDVFFDVGANVGFFSLVASRSVGNLGSLYAFEARSDIARAAEANFPEESHSGDRTSGGRRRPRRNCDAARGEPSGVATIEESAASDTHHAVTVEQVAIDTLIRTGRIPAPDVVEKIDVEGAELAVIRGMTETMRTWRPHLVFEIDAPDRAGMEDRYTEARQVLAELGYRCTRLAPSYVGTGWHVLHAVAENRERSSADPNRGRGREQRSRSTDLTAVAAGAASHGHSVRRWSDLTSRASPGSREQGVGGNDVLRTGPSRPGFSARTDETGWPHESGNRQSALRWSSPARPRLHRNLELRDRHPPCRRLRGHGLWQVPRRTARYAASSAVRGSTA